MSADHKKATSKSADPSASKADAAVAPSSPHRGDPHNPLHIPPTEARYLNSRLTAYGWQIIFAAAACASVMTVCSTLLLVMRSTKSTACDPLATYLMVQLVTGGMGTLALIVAVVTVDTAWFRQRRGWWLAVPLFVLSHVHFGGLEAHEWLTDGSVRVRAAVSSCRRDDAWLFHIARANVYLVLVLASAMALVVALACGSYAFECAKRGGGKKAVDAAKSS